jgi:multidrug resistance efflux pump
MATPRLLLNLTGGLVAALLPVAAAAQQPPAGSLPAATPQSLNLPAATPPAASPQVAGAAFVAQTPVANSPIQGEKAQIMCFYKVPVAAQADGLIEQLLVEEGVKVKKGDLLLKIDDRVVHAELAVASKEAEASAAQAKQTANLRFSKKAAEVSDAEFEEWKDLYERKSASYQEVRRKMLEAQKARLGIEVAEVDHEKDQLTAEVAKQKVEAVKVQLAMREVRSQYDGVIFERMHNQGEWVRAGEPILKLIHLNEMRVEARIRLGNYSPLQLVNAPVRVNVAIGGSTRTFNSKIEFVSPVVEFNSVRVWTRVPNEMVGEDWLLSDGMEATIDVTPLPMQ